MRSGSLARRAITLTLGVALAATVAACSSSSSTSAASSASATTSAPASASATAASSGPASSGSSGSVEAITVTWEKFFSSSTAVAEKVKLLQNGSTFAGAINDLAKLPLASGIGAKVTAVTVKSATTATVTYNLTDGSASLLSDQSGTSVYQDGGWKVGDASLCALFKLVPGGTLPAACSSAG